MTRHRPFTLLFAGALTASVCAAQVIPSITSLSPSAVAAGSGAFNLTVLGSNFQDGATIYWNGLPFRTIFVNSGQLSASIQSNLVNSPGSASISVTNPG